MALRRWTTTIVVAVMVAAGCGGDGGDDGDDVASDPVTPVELPFGLAQLDGTEPIGRPAVYDSEAYVSNGDPVESRALTAAYRVTADDPLAVFRAWAEQLDGLTLDEVAIEAYRDGGVDPWVEMLAEGDDWARLQLWATDDGPILLVSVERISDEPPRPTNVVDNAGSVPAPEAFDLGATGRTAGDELFTEQGQTIHLPAGTTALMPTLPTPGGTGGSTSVLAAEDPEAAIDEMLAEALELSPEGRAEPAEITESDGTTIITASYILNAGGWSFSVVSVQHPTDPTATLYISSAAD